MLGVASLLTDLSSEMIMPLLPAFLAGSLGAGAVALGVIEGVADSTASFLKLWAGVLTDRFQRRKPFIVAGYSISGLIRPLVGLALSWPFVAGIRFLDRVGKGVRTSPRDALIADVTPPELRGRAYGLHRGMDHMGAVVGPLVAMLLLGPLALELRTVFFLTAIPAVLVVLVLILGVRERPAAAPLADAPARPRPALPTLSTWRELPAELRRLVGALLVFTLGNATDAFIALLLFESGVEMKWIALLWSLHHALKVLSTWGGGWLADRLPRRRLVILGWLLYAAIYFAFALLDGAAWQVGIFMAYAICFGIIEPAERAWVAELAGAEQRGTAFGFTSAVTGLGALPASLMFGFLWKIGGAGVAFATGATLALVAALLLALPHQERKRPTSSR